MKIGKLLGAVAAMSMVAAPVMAAPTRSAAKLSLSKDVRTGKSVAGAEELRGGFIIPAIAIIAIILGIVVLADDDDRPTSP